MKRFDLVRLACRSLTGRQAVLPAAGIAAAAFCLCFAGTIFTTVQQEKAQPYELILSSEGNTSLTDNIMAEISQMQSVLATTPALPVHVVVKTGEYSAKLTLTGIDAVYMEADFSSGSRFPDNSVMPYIVLNEAACKQFANSKAYVQEAETPEIDWLRAGFSLQAGEGSRWITSKVCGILTKEEAEETQEPAAYISLSVAKELLQNSGQSAEYTTAYVRVTDIGQAASVSKALAALGLSVTNSTGELQAGWDADIKEMVYLVVTGAFGLCCASVLLAAERRISLLQQRQAWDMLRWMGLKVRSLRSLFCIQNLLLSVIGTALGILAATALPLFLSSGTVTESNFALAVPFQVAVVSAVICMGAGLLPFCWMRKTVNPEVE